MKKIIEIVLLLVIVFATFITSATAQKNSGNAKNQKGKADTTVKKIVDSLPTLPDSVEYVSNRDLLWINEVIKKVMTSDEYKRSGDVISQYQMLVVNMNQIFEACRRRWEINHSNAIKYEPANNKINLP